MQGILNPLYGHINDCYNFEGLKCRFLSSLTLNFVQRLSQQSEAIIDKRKPKTSSVQNINHLQQNMLEILLYNPYYQLQIILKIKAQMSYWQLFYVI